METNAAADDGKQQIHAEHQHQSAEPHHPHSAHAGHGGRGRFHKYKLPATVFVLYLIIAMVVFAPVTANMTNTTLGTGGDAYLNMWDIWWVNYATFNLHTSFWTTNMVFYPVGENLVYHTLAPLAGILAAPFSAVSLPFAYDALFFIGIALSGLATYLLADYFVRNKHAAFLAGILFAFSAPYISQAKGLLIFTQLEWIPFALYFFIRMLKEKKPIFAVGLAISFIFAAFMGSFEMAMMVSMLLLLVLALYIINNATRKLVLSPAFAKNLAIAIVAALVLGFWGFIPLYNTISQPGGLAVASNNMNALQNNIIWSADVLNLFIPSYYNSAFYSSLANSYLYQPDPQERVAYIGYVVLALCAIALWKKFDRRKLLWVAIIVVFVDLGLGPSVQIGGTLTGIPTLYNVYHAFSGINIIREPGRFAVVSALGFAVLAAFGAAYLLERWGARAKMGAKKFSIILTAALAIIYLFESTGLIVSGPVLGVMTTHVVNPAIYPELALVPGNFTTFSIPALPSAGASPDIFPAESTYYQALSHKAIVGGLDGRYTQQQLYSLYNIPLTVQSLALEDNPNAGLYYASPVNENYTNQTIFTLYNYNTAFVIVYGNAYNQASATTLLGYLQNTFGSPVYVDNTTAAFETLNAINRSIYGSYVAYPQIGNWTEVRAQGQATANSINTTINLWIPSYPGEVLVYAPFSGRTGLQQKIANDYTEPVNTTITFNAISVTGLGSITIALANGNSTLPIARFNLTNHLQTYSAQTVLMAGRNPDILLFVPQYPVANQTAIGLSNITFSRT